MAMLRLLVAVAIMAPCASFSFLSTPLGLRHAVGKRSYVLPAPSSSRRMLRPAARSVLGLRATSIADPAKMKPGAPSLDKLELDYSEDNLFHDGELVIVKRSDGKNYFARVDASTEDGRYVVCVDEEQGKYRKELPKDIGKLVGDDHMNDEKAIPPPAKMAGAYVSSMAQYNQMYKQSLEEPEKFWGMISKDFYWKEMWHTLNEVNFDYTKGPVSIKWFLGSKTNLAYNALDRHIEAGKGDNIAFYWEGNDDESRAYTYKEIYEMVCKFANVLKSKGIKKGDTVAIYLPMVVELPVAMLACARIGAVHSVVFGGFSADALASRIADCKARVLVTADGVMRAKKLVNLLDIVDSADKIVKEDKEANHKLDHIIVVERNSKAGPLKEHHEAWNKAMEGVSADCPVEWMDAEDPLFLLYTSGSTGKPKVLISHVSPPCVERVAYRECSTRRPATWSGRQPRSSMCLITVLGMCIGAQLIVDGLLVISICPSSSFLSCTGNRSFLHHIWTDGERGDASAV
eukprot:766482-Hanusia_phi.AAC.5